MKVLRHSFSLACFATAFGMSIYWFYMFLKDEDLVQINLKTSETIDKSQDTMASFCFKDPIIESKLKTYNDTITAQKYLEFLYGYRLHVGSNSIDFDDITLNLMDYYLEDTIAFHNGTYMQGIAPNFVHEKPHVTYSGFYDGQLIKCFGMRSTYTGVSYSSFRFNSSLFPNGIRNNYFRIFLHLRNRFLLAGSSVKFSWPNRTMKKEYATTFWLQQVEIIKRRNKRTNPCLSDSSSYDDTILNDHLEEVGCNLPNQKRNENFKPCESLEKIRKARYDVMRNKRSKIACTTAASIMFAFEEEDWNWKGSDWFHVFFMDPYHIKEIVMVKAVDIQTAIGNAGGYIGLFLGKSMSNSKLLSINSYPSNHIKE